MFMQFIRSAFVLFLSESCCCLDPLTVSRHVPSLFRTFFLACGAGAVVFLPDKKLSIELTNL